MKDYFNLKKSKLLLLTLLAFFVGASPAWADELTVYDGTTTNSYVPIYGYYVDDSNLKSEYIIPASQLEDLDGGTISKLKLYLSSSPSWSGLEYKIVLKEVTDANFSTATLLADNDNEATTVYEGAISVVSNELAINFTNNYVYNGGNLLVGFYIKQTCNYGSASFYGQSVTNAAVYSYKGWSSITTTQANFGPKTTFTYTPAAGTVKKPTELTVSAITYEAATLSWTAGEDETEWEVAVNETGETPAAEGSYTAVSTNPTTIISGLEQETTYFAFVRAKKDGKYSKWSDKVSFTTTERYPAPAGLAISNVTPTSATLTWEAAIATAWEVAINTTGATPEEAGTVVNVATYDFSELTAETTYYAFVRTKDGDNYSAWSAACEFTPSAYTYLTVNNGTTTNSYVPINANSIWGSTKAQSQFLILSSALTDMINCELKKMIFYSSADDNNFGNGEFDVYLKEVTNTSVTSSTLVGWDTMTKVYSGKLSVSGGKMTIVFDNSYEYQGGNLLIGFNQTVKDSNGTTLNWYCVSTSDYMGVDKSYGRVKFSPKTTIGYQEKTGSELKVFDGETELTESPASFDFGLAAEGETHTFTLKNTAATPYEAAITSTNLTVAPAAVTPTAEGVTFTVTMPVNDITNEPVVITPAAASGLEPFTINVSGTVRDADKFYQVFNTTSLPSDWSVDGSWSYSAANGATTSAWFTSSNARLKTPLLTIAADEKFIVEAKGNSDSYQHVQLQYSADGTTWTNLGEELELTSSFKTFTVNVPAEFVAGNYYIGLLASQASIRMYYGGEKVSGAVFAINVTEGATQDFGKVSQDATAEKTFTITNSGDAVMNVSVAIPDGFEAEVVKTSSIKFTNNKGWSTVKAYAWNSSNEALTAGWPGDDVAWSYNNDMEQGVHIFNIPAGAVGVVFNAGGDENKTADITDFAHEGYYISSDSNPFAVTAWPASQNVSFTIAAGETGQFKVAMKTEAPGTKSGDVVITNNSLNKASSTIPVTGIVKDPNLLAVDFEDDAFPAGWQVGTNWSVGYANSNYYAVQSATSLANASALVTAPLTVGEDETLTFKVARNASGSSNKTSLQIRYSQDGGVNWSDYTTYYDSNDTNYGASLTPKTISGIPAGTVIIEFYGCNIKLDDIEGFTKTNKPAIAVTESTAAVANGDTKDFGFLSAEGTATYTVKNIGNATLNATISGTGVTVSPANISVAAGETADVTVTLAYAEPYGARTGMSMTIDSDDAWISDFVVNFEATLNDPTAFVETFTGTETPAGWYNGGWTINEVASVALGTSRDLITKKIEAAEGKNVLTFKAKYSNEYLSKTLNVYTSTDRKDWTLKKEYSLTADYADVTLDALEDGQYYVKFEAANAIIDDVQGLKEVALPSHDIFMVGATLPTGNITPIDTYTATVKVASLCAEENVTADLYFGETKVATTTKTISNGSTETIEIEGNAPVAGTFEVYVKVSASDINLETEKVNVAVEDKTELTISNFAAVASSVQADEDNNFTAEFNVTLKNTGSTAIAANEVSVSITDEDDVAYGEATTWTPGETIYLKPGNYTADNANLAIYRWTDGENNAEWALFAAGADGIYTADLNGRAKFIICRTNPDIAVGDLSFSNGVWTQSNDLTTTSGNVFENNGYDNGKLNMTQSNSLLAGMTVSMTISVTAPAGNGGEFEFKAKENKTNTFWSGSWGDTQTVNVTAAPTLALDETDYAKSFVEGNKYYEVTLNRPFIAEWNTLVLPFDFAAAKFEGATFYEFAANNGGELKFTKVTAETLTAGTPYLVYLTDAIDAPMTFNKVEITAATATDVEKNDAHFIGNYNYGMSMVDKYGVTPDGLVKKGDTGSWMKAYRAYITMPAGQTARIAIFDETTGISRVLSAKELEGTDIFNMKGQRVSESAKGVVIINGKKVVIK